MARRQQRVQVGSGITPGSLNPVASPVDTFVQTRAGSQLAQLAAGMTKLAPGLGAIAGQLQEQTNERDKAAGIKKARELAESGKSYAAAIKEGLITPDMSPWFRAGLREQYGRVTAEKWEADLTIAVATDPAMQNTTDMGEVDAFVGKHREEWLEQNLGENDRDEFFEVGWGNRSDALVGNVRREMARVISGRIMQQSDDLMHAEVLAGTERSLKDGFAPEVIGADLTALADSKYGLNPKGSDRANRSITDAIVSLARRQNDSSILGILSHVKVGPQGAKTRLTLADTKYAAEAIEEAENQIGRENNEKYWNEKRMEEQERGAQVRGILGSVTAALDDVSSPHTVSLEPFIEEMQRVDPLQVQRIYELQDAYSDRTYQDSPHVVADAWRRVHTIAPGQSGYFTIESAAALLGSKQITPVTFRQLVQEIEQRDGAGGTSRFYGDDGLRKGIQRARSLFVSETGEGSVDARWRAELAEAEFTRRYVEWRRGRGAEAGVGELNEFISEQTADIFFSEGISSEITSELAPGFIPALDSIKKRVEQRQAGQPTGPQVPDYTKVGVVSRPSYEMIAREIEERRTGKRNRLSADVVNTLRYFGISTPEDLDEFLAAQKRLAR